jgi:hypothetical protein
MEIQPAQEKDIIDVLYLLKKEMENNSPEANYRLPVPDYLFLKEEIRLDRLFILKHHKISIGTFSTEPKASGGQAGRGNPTLKIHRMALTPYWINQQTIQELLCFLEQHARKKGFAAIRFNINSHNEQMNTFYQKLNLNFLGKASHPSLEHPFLLYEKSL